MWVGPLPVGQPGHGGGHGHAVVPAGVDGPPAGQSTGAVHDQVVAVDLGPGPERPDQVRHAGQSVRLLHPQLPHVP